MNTRLLTNQFWVLIIHSLMSFRTQQHQQQQLTKGYYCPLSLILAICPIPILLSSCLALTGDWTTDSHLNPAKWLEEIRLNENIILIRGEGIDRFLLPLLLDHHHQTLVKGVESLKNLNILIRGEEDDQHLLSLHQIIQ